MISTAEVKGAKSESPRYFAGDRSKRPLSTAGLLQGTQKKGYSKPRSLSSMYFTLGVALPAGALMDEEANSGHHVTDVDSGPAKLAIYV